MPLAGELVPIVRVRDAPTRPPGHAATARPGRQRLQRPGSGPEDSPGTRAMIVTLSRAADDSAIRRSVKSRSHWSMSAIGCGPTKKMLPRIPLLADPQPFIAAGRALSELHLGYEAQDSQSWPEPTRSSGRRPWVIFEAKPWCG